MVVFGKQNNLKAIYFMCKLSLDILRKAAVVVVVGHMRPVGQMFDMLGRRNFPCPTQFIPELNLILLTRMLLHV